MIHSFRWLVLGAFLLIAPGLALAEVLATWEDPVGDDTGDGDYTYPANPAFADCGMADLLAFAIEKENGNLIFEFRIGSLVDPWQVGNRLTMAAVAIDHLVGDERDLLGDLGATPPHEALDGVDRPRRVGHRLALGDGADRALVFFGERHHRGGRATALLVGDDRRLTTLHHRHHGVRGTEVDPDDLAI